MKRTIGMLRERWQGFFSRSALRTAQVGVIPLLIGKDADRKFRNPKLELLDAYYENRQYDHLVPWDQEEGSDGNHIPVRHRKPRITFALPKALCGRVAAKLIGQTVFPKLKVEGFPEDEEFVKAIIRSSRLKGRIIEPTRRMLAAGSVFVRFYLSGGQIKLEHYLSKYCYPEFNPSGELERVTIKYVFEDKDDRDENGNAKLKWFKMELGNQYEILYDNPEYDPEAKEEPQFIEVDRVEHGLGFVQGEWFTTYEDKDSPDGISLIGDAIDFFDELNYSLSQSSKAISYNQDPQLVLSKMDEDEINDLLRSSSKAWNLGREGDGKFLESSMTGVRTAMDFRDKVRLFLQDETRVILMDPEKIAAQAQSGRALEILHGPMVDLILEIRPLFEVKLINLVTKMAVSVLIAARRGMETPIIIPDGYHPESLDITAAWPPVFPMTIEDLQKKANLGVTVANARLISSESITRWLANDFGIENVEDELERIRSQPIVNPFGFGGGF